MKKLKIDLKGAPIIILLEVVIAVVVCAALIGGVILPSFNSWLAVSAENTTTKTKIETIERNIQEVSSLNASQVQSLKNFLDSYLPSDQQAIPLFVLMENLASASGVKISVGQLEVTNANGLVGTGQVATSPAPASTTGFNLKTTVDGSYQNIQTFLQNLKTIDRLVNITSVTVSPSAATGSSSMALDLKIPTFGVAAIANPQVLVSLTKAEIDQLEVIASGVSITATASSKPVGRSSPF